MSTRYLIAVFICSKLLGLLAGLVLFRDHGDQELVRSMLVHFVSLTFFIVFATVVSWPRLTVLRRAIGPRAGCSIPSLAWVPIALIAGIFFRVGAEGMYLAGAYVISPMAAHIEIQDLRSLYMSTASVPPTILLLGATFMGALEEEFVYRGVALWSLWDRYGPSLAICLTALVFGLMHFNPIAVIAGILLAEIYLLSGKLWVAVLAHMAGNLWHPFAKASGIGVMLTRQGDMAVTYFAVPTLVVALFLCVAFVWIRRAPMASINCR